jgi:hypothetical protein
MVVPGNDIRASRRWRPLWGSGQHCRGAVRGIVRTIRFGFVLDIDSILVADFIKFLGRNQSVHVVAWRFRRWLPRLHDRPFRFPPLAGPNLLGWWRFRS